MKAFAYSLIITLILFAFLHVALSKPISEKIGYVGGNTLGIQISIGDKNISTKKFPDFLETNIKKEIATKSGKHSVFIKHINTQQTVNINPNETYYLASLYKIPVAIVTLQEIEKGNISMEDKITFTNDDIYYGTGTIQYDKIGTQYSVEELLKRLLKESDNIAQSMLFTKVDKKLVDKMIPKPEAVTVSEIGVILESLYKNEYLTEKSSSQLFEYLANTSFDDRVDLGLENGVTFSHKIGSWGESGSWHDCGVILDNTNPLVICIMSKHTTYEEFLAVSKTVGENINKILY